MTVFPKRHFVAFDNVKHVFPKKTSSANLLLIFNWELRMKWSLVRLRNTIKVYTSVPILHDVYKRATEFVHNLKLSFFPDLFYYMRI